MPNFPQDVYARNLISPCGYLLRTPEPNIELPESYQRAGFKIGDVGVVVPEDGSFDVFFNICLPPNHQLHATNGVPDNFSPIILGSDDYKTVPDAEGPGRIFSTPSVKWTLHHVDPYEVAGRPRRLTDHRFNLSPNEGALLVLPQGADSYRLAKELLFLDHVVQNAVSWYQFARQRLYRNIPNGSLYVITGFHKACSWSLASFENSGEFQARCEVVQLEKGGPFVPEASAWEALGPLDWRIGPRNYVGNPNQTVFITGFKIAVDEELLHWKRVTVKSEHPHRTLATRLVGFGSTLANFVLGESKGVQTPENESQREPPNDSINTSQRQSTSLRRKPRGIEPLLAREPFPHILDGAKKAPYKSPKKRKRPAPTTPPLTFNPNLNFLPFGRHDPSALPSVTTGPSASEPWTSSTNQLPPAHIRRPRIFGGVPSAEYLPLFNPTLSTTDQTESSLAPSEFSYTPVLLSPSSESSAALEHVGKSTSLDTGAGITVQRVLSVSNISHPSDIIHRYLFKKAPSAKIAVVHDSVWITLLEKGLLTREELFQEERLEEALSRNFYPLFHQGAVYLQSSSSDHLGDAISVHVDVPGNVGH